MSQSEYWDKFMWRRMSRREILKGATLAGAGLLASAAAGCSGSTQQSASASPTAPPAGTKAASAASPVASPTAAQKFQRGGALNIAHIGDFQTLNPLESASAYDSAFTFPVFDRLLKLDKNWEPKPHLAESWDVSDPTKVVFRLRKGVKFHDGTDLNAQAVKATFDVILDPSTKGFGFRDLSKVVASIDATDDNTVVFRLKSTFAPLLGTLANQGTEIISPAAMKKLGKADFGRAPVGSGPFKFVEWVTGDHVTTAKWDGYWSKDEEGNAFPYLDQVVYKIIPDETVRVTSVRTGAADVAVRVPAKDVKMLQSDQNVVLLMRAAPGVYELRFNNQKPPTNNPVLRQALAYATDRQAINQAVFLGLGELGRSQRGPAAWDWNPDLPNYPMDLNKAKEKLAEAKYPDGLSLTMDSRNESWSTMIGEILRDQWSKVGVKVEINLIDIAKLATRLGALDFQTSIGNMPGSPDPNTEYGQYQSQGGVWPAVNNAKVDQLIKQGVSTYDLAERKKIYQELSRIITFDEAAKIFLVHSPETVLLSKRVQNYDLYPYPLNMDLAKVWLKR